MQQVFVVGDEPVPGYRLAEDLGGSAFYKMWKVQTADGAWKLWKVIDLVVGNAAVETRTLGLLIQLRHPHLNTLTNFWQLDDGKTLIIETDVPALSLRDRLDQVKAAGQRGLTREVVLPYILQAAEGLDFLNAPRHQFNGEQVAIYHRALRPECLLLFPEESRLVCKVSDFGLSKPVTDEVAQNSQGLLHYDYDPPEFFEGQNTSTSDQYALAINYYELRTGELPFKGSMLQQLQARLNDKPELDQLEEPERSIVRKALSRDPRGRFENCLAFARQIELNDYPAGAAPGGASVARRAPLPSQRTPGAPLPRPSAAGVTSGARTANPSPLFASPPGAPAAEPRPNLTPPAAARAPLPPPIFTHRKSPSSSSDNVLRAPAAGPATGREATSDTPSAPTAAPQPIAKLPEPAPQVEPVVPKTSSREIARDGLAKLRHLAKSSEGGYNSSLGDERRVPLLWVLVILFVTVGGVYAAMNVLAGRLPWVG